MPKSKSFAPAGSVSGPSGILANASYPHMMGTPMNVDDHPVNNVQDPHGNYTSGPAIRPGKVNPKYPGIM